jgi:hypothetical protein
MIVDDLVVDPDAFAARTGWEFKPQGACKGEVCVPMPPEMRVGDDQLDVRVIAERLGMPLVHDDAHDVWAIGPETAVTGRVLSTAQMPTVVIPDAEGNPFDLSTLHGQKVLLVAWASW